MISLKDNLSGQAVPLYTCIHMHTHAYTLTTYMYMYDDYDHLHRNNKFQRIAE